MKNKIVYTEKTAQKSGKGIARIILLIVLLVLIGLYFFAAEFNTKVNEIIVIFASMNVESVAEYIRSFGIWAVVVSFLLMVFQSVAAPLPAFLITFANAAIFGWWQGALLSWSSAMAGAILCFYIARIAGRDAVEKLTSKLAMNSVDEYFARYGKHTILICRLLPFVSFDFVSYAAGLTAMGTVPFIIATGLGQLPATIVYSYVGGMLTGSAQVVVTALLIIFALLTLTVLLKRVHGEIIERDSVKEIKD
ncbi:MAG: TVP38/TMEM64 family protein [Eubacteriales bacterium]